MKILIYGLSTSGKSTLANRLADNFGNYLILNGDTIRELHEDWDFSYNGRLRQMYRVISLAENHENVIMDIVCPLEEYRKLIKPDVSILMNTIKECQYEDTNKMFENGSPTIEVLNWDYDLEEIVEQIFRGTE